MIPRLLITRAEPGASATAETVQARGGQALKCPLFVIRPTGAALPSFEKAQAIAFTSAHAVRASGAIPRDLPVFAVGGGTARAAAATGFDQVYSADGDAAALAALLIARLAPARGAILHLRGADQAFDMAAALQSAGFEVRSAVLYEAAALEALGPEQQALAARATGVLLHSPRGAVAAARLFAPFAPHLTAICISPATAVTAKAAPFKAFKVAQRPHEEALMDCAFAQTDAKG
jgi:uroporphyrinogen-III synthase